MQNTERWIASEVGGAIPPTAAIDNQKKYRIMRTILKGLIAAVMGACGFVAIGEMDDCSFTEMVVMKLVASGLLLYCVKCYKAIGEHDTDGTRH